MGHVVLGHHVCGDGLALREEGQRSDRHCVRSERTPTHGVHEHERTQRSGCDCAGGERSRNGVGEGCVGVVGRLLGEDDTGDHEDYWHGPRDAVLEQGEVEVQEGHDCKHHLMNINKLHINF